MITTEETQYGVRYLNGEEDWNTRNWFGHIETREMRESFQEQYNLRLKMFGAPPMPVSFLTRTVTTSISDAVVIDDTLPEVPPVVEDEGEAAPDNGVEDPAVVPIVEGESPVDTDTPVNEENNGNAG